MRKSNILTNIFSYLSLVSGIIWFGSYVARLLVTYQLFEPEDLTLKNYINASTLPVVIQTIHPLVNLTFFSYLIFVTFFTIFLILSSLKFKQNGWMFIISMIVYLTLPFEAILLVIDYKLIVLFLSSNFSSGDIIKLLIERITTLNSFPIIMFFSYLAIPYFLLFKPFTLNSNNEN